MGTNIDPVRIDSNSGLEDSDGMVTAGGFLLDLEEKAWPYPDSVEPSTPGSDIALPLTPSHDWANRGPSTMWVWIPTT